MRTIIKIMTMMVEMIIMI